MAWLCATVLVTLLLGEVLCRASPDLAGAMAHRARFRLALLHARDDAELVLMGTSRANDCLAPGQLAEALSQKSGQPVRAVSLAVPSSSLPLLERLAQ